MVQISVAPLQERDVPAADRIMRVAFGTFIGLPDPTRFGEDSDFVRTRWRADPTAAFAATVNDEIVGSNFATSWGSVGFFGPLTIRPDYWDRGGGKQLMEPVLRCFEIWETRIAGLYTFPHSQKHVGLYQRFGFWPRFLTAVMARTVGPATLTGRPARFSELREADRESMLRECGQVSGSVCDGLDVSREIRAVADQRLGDTLLLDGKGGTLAGFAICHAGPGTEAGSGACYVKFGVVRSGHTAPVDFARLVDACESFASERGATRLVAGVNLARREAYRLMLERGFRTEIQGVAMHKPDEPGYNRAGVYLIDDWR
jgi:GNAT superfamily N-acetyltransferase